MTQERGESRAAQATWPDQQAFLKKVREGVFDDSELRIGLLNMGALPDVELDGEALPEVQEAIVRELDRVRSEAGLPPLKPRTK